MFLNAISYTTKSLFSTHKPFTRELSTYSKVSIVSSWLKAQITHSRVGLTTSLLVFNNDGNNLATSKSTLINDT